MIQLSLQTAKYCPAIVCLCDYARLAAIVRPFSSVLRNNNELLVVLYLHALSLIRRKLKNMHKNNNKQTNNNNNIASSFLFLEDDCMSSLSLFPLSFYLFPLIMGTT